MPIDETILNDIITVIINKINVNKLERNSLRDLYNLAFSIALKEVSDATPKDPRKTKLVIPNDIGMGMTMTEERRQKIFDKLLKDKDTLKLN